MRKTYPLRPEGKNPDRVLEAVKYDIRKYIQRERRDPLPAGADFWDFDCRCGPDKDSAESLHVAGLNARLDELARGGATQCHVELFARPAQWQRRAPAEAADATACAPAQGDAPVSGE